MSRTGDCYDNAVAKRFFWSLKHGWTNHEEFANPGAARLSVFECIENSCNPKRRHQTLGYKSPDQFEADHAPAQAASNTDGNYPQVVGYREREKGDDKQVDRRRNRSGLPPIS